MDLGLIQELTGPVFYTMLLGNGKLVRRHIDQLFSRKDSVLIPDLTHKEECVVPPPVTNTELLKWMIKLYHFATG